MIKKCIKIKIAKKVYQFKIAQKIEKKEFYKKVVKSSTSVTWKNTSEISRPSVFSRNFTFTNVHKFFKALYWRWSKKYVTTNPSDQTLIQSHVMVLSHKDTQHACYYS